MDIILFWFLFSAVVASAANSRGRSSSGWLLLSIVISPLLAGLLVLALPRLNRIAVNNISEVRPSPASKKRPAFEPDGVYAGIPYKVSETGALEVMLSGGRVRFRSMEQFLALAMKDSNLGKFPQLRVSSTAVPPARP